MLYKNHVDMCKYNGNDMKEWNDVVIFKII